MDQERARIQEDLRGLLDGEVRCDDLFIQMYASDASIYEIRPLGIVRPRGVADVVACVQYAAAHEIPLHARGAGTGVAGESLGPGLILDFSHTMRRVLSIEDDKVRVQPGVVLANLNWHLRGVGRFFGPDPSTRSVTTLGSVLAVDASGSHWLKYGSARQHVESLQVVLADGQVIEAGSHPVASTAANDGSPARQRLVQRLAELLDREQQTIATHQPKTMVNCSGYQLSGVLRDGKLDLAKLIVGSEGTLAFITEATLRTVPMPRSRGLALLFFDRLEFAARSALEIAGTGVSACDLMDRRLLSLARELDVRYDVLIPANAEAMLLIECQGDEDHEVREQLQEIVNRVQRHQRLAFDTRITLEREERDLYWRLTRRVVQSLSRLKGHRRAVPFIEDIAVPPPMLPDFLVRLQNVLKIHGVTASLYGHVGHGELHVRPFLDLNNPEHVRMMHDLATDFYQEVLAVGGTISGEHADGLSRTWFLRQQYGPLYEVFREVKRIFDPQFILNPGKIVADAPQPLTKNLRPAFAGAASPAGSNLTAGSSLSEPTPLAPEFRGEGLEVRGAAAELPPPASPLFDLQLVWKPDADLEMTARDCNGCGRCRTQWHGERMCPVFRFMPAEEASPRAKANLMRAIVSGRLSPEQLATDEMKAVADLCVNCHQCRLECPSNVDIPKLMLECKAQYVATNGLRTTDWFFTRLEKIASLTSRLPWLFNWAIGNRQMRWLLEKLLGIAQGRKLPRVSGRSFLRQSHRLKLDRPARFGGRKVLYFVDLYANWYDPKLAEALVAVMRHNGVSVYVHPGQVPSGAAAVSVGAVDRAKWLAARNVPILADAVRQGYHIVTSEPSAALCLRHDYPNLLDEDDARLVADNTSEACAYLWQMHLSGKLELDLNPINATVAYHWPCHQRALEQGAPGENLLRLIPGLTVQHLEKGCSGMAGTFGMKRLNYRSSLRAGWSLIAAMRSPSIQVGTTECSACKIQMEQGTSKPTIHPLKILALAYGLMPEFEDLFSARGEELIVT